MLATTENPNAVVFYMFAILVPLSIGPAAADWISPGWADLPMILAFGVLSLISMQSWTRSLAAAPASVGMPLVYLQLPFVAVLGFLFYGQTSDLWTWVGGAVICASGYYVFLAEARARADRRPD
jgi:drug/metabolite transporter (DMT)-like permease